MSPPLSRRTFVHQVALATAGGLASCARHPSPRRHVRFGLIADIHPDVLPDGLQRVQAFVRAMTDARVDFILQLGDFVWPRPSNKPYLEAWNRFPGPRFHVLGNHDMDEGYTREQTVAFVGMPATHYTFPAGPALGVVLDGNEPGGSKPGYRRHVGAAQRTWLAQTLASATQPCLIFIHQPFDSDLDDALENAPELRSLVEAAERSKPGTVLAVFSGHLHLDYAVERNGIRYFGMNSAAYWWLNNPAARREVYPPDIHKAFRWASHVAPYRDPLWATVSLDLDRAELRIEGTRSDWIGPDPWTRGESTERPRDQLHPWISSQRVRLNA